MLRGAGEGDLGSGIASRALRAWPKSCPGSKEPRRTWWGVLRGCSDPGLRTAFEMGAGAGRAATFAGSPQTLSLSFLLVGLQFVWNCRVQVVAEAGEGGGLHRNARSSSGSRVQAPLGLLGHQPALPCSLPVSRGVAGTETCGGRKSRNRRCQTSEAWERASDLVLECVSQQLSLHAREHPLLRYYK